MTAKENNESEGLVLKNIVNNYENIRNTESILNC